MYQLDDFIHITLLSVKWKVERESNQIEKLRKVVEREGQNECSWCFLAL